MGLLIYLSVCDRHLTYPHSAISPVPYPIRPDIIRNMTGTLNGGQNSIESRVKSRARRERIQDIVLRTLFLASAVGIMMAAPNSARLLRYFQKYLEKRDTKLGRRISQAYTRLKEKGMIEKKENGAFRLTKKGEEHAAALQMLDLTQKPLLRWDRKWRIVIFDIWERRHVVRNRLRELLKRNGFVKIQNSVWVYPYDCEELFAFLRTHLSLGRGMLYIVADEIEGDSQLRKHFKLPAT